VASCPIPRLSDGLEPGTEGQRILLAEALHTYDERIPPAQDERDPEILNTFLRH
jgi:hypothetical protein